MILRIGNAAAAAAVASTMTAVLTLLPFLLWAPAMVAYVALVAGIVAGGHAALIGVPLYLVLRRVWPLRWWSAALGGAAVGLGPTMLIVLTKALRNAGPVLDTSLLVPAAWLALVGGVGGIAFWSVLRGRSPR